MLKGNRNFPCLAARLPTMCARYQLLNGRAITDDFGAVPLPEMGPMLDILPGDAVPAIYIRDGQRHGHYFQWGLVPQWAQDPAIGKKLINARGETLTEKPSFRGAVRYRRCILPASGFYEWKGPKGSKVPHLIRRRNGKTLAMAGLYEVWERGEGYLETCTIVTCAANPEVSELHDRMPVILEGAAIDAWLDKRITQPERILPLVQPLRAGQLEILPFDPRGTRETKAKGVPDLDAWMDALESEARAKKKQSAEQGSLFE